jgi:hypothetical protein
MDGVRPRTGRRVGLLDAYQLWAFLSDPFKTWLPYQLYIEPSMGRQLNDMVNFFVPDSSELEDDKELASDV